MTVLRRMGPTMSYVTSSPCLISYDIKPRGKKKTKKNCIVCLSVVFLDAIIYIYIIYNILRIQKETRYMTVIQDEPRKSSPGP